MLNTPISIHAPRVGSDVLLHDYPIVTFKISIHAPRVGSDQAYNDPELSDLISIHAPRVGSDDQE